MIASILLDVACDLARGRVWTALRFEETPAAVSLQRKIAQLVVSADVASGLEQLVRGTHVYVTLAIKREVIA